MKKVIIKRTGVIEFIMQLDGLEKRIQKQNPQQWILKDGGNGAVIFNDKIPDELKVQCYEVFLKAFNSMRGV